MVGTVVTFSGAIGSRRSELSERVAGDMDWRRVKFSTYISAAIRADGETPSRALLQSYGQEFVQHRLTEFVGAVLGMAEEWEKGRDLVVDGLRHTEVLLELRRQVHPSRLVYVHVKADPIRREEDARGKGIGEDMLYRYDRSLTELQLPEILPAYADLTVDGELGLGLNARRVEERLRQLGGPPTA